MNYIYISCMKITDTEIVLPVIPKITFNQILGKKNEAKKIKKEKYNKKVAKKAQKSNKDLFEAKKNGSSKDRYIFISLDESDIEVSEKEESSRNDSKKNKGNIGQGDDLSDSEYSLLDERREKIRRNRSKTPSQQNWKKIIDKASMRVEMPKKTSKIKVDIPMKVNDDAKWKNAVVYDNW